LASLHHLSGPQIQTRDLEGFVESRQQLLALKPALRNHWISFALAHHANRSFEVAVQALEAYEKTLDEVGVRCALGGLLLCCGALGWGAAAAVPVPAPARWARASWC